jgi:hypothetical protein
MKIVGHLGLFEFWCGVSFDDEILIFIEVVEGFAQFLDVLGNPVSGSATQIVFDMVCFRLDFFCSQNHLTVFFGVNPTAVVGIVDKANHAACLNPCASQRTTH